MHRWEVLDLPSQLEVLANPFVLGVFGLMTLAEFIMDKFPGAASAWDWLNGPVRVAAGVALPAAALADVSGAAASLGGLSGAAVSATSFLGNRSVRESAKAAPGSGSIFSLGKDGIVVSVMWFVANHPYWAMVIVLVLLALCIVAIYYFVRLLKRIVRKISGKLSAWRRSAK